MADDEEDAWGDAIDDASAPSNVTKDVMRKARQLNPALAAQGSTTELFSKIKGGSPASAPAGGPTGGMLGKQDFAAGFYAMQERYKEDRKRIQAEIAKLQKALADTAPKTLEKLIELVIDVDPNMTSPQTQEIFKSEIAFLNEVGFSVRKVIDRKMKKK